MSETNGQIKKKLHHQKAHQDQKKKNFFQILDEEEEEVEVEVEAGEEEEEEVEVEEEEKEIMVKIDGVEIEMDLNSNDLEVQVLNHPTREEMWKLNIFKKNNDFKI